MARRVGRGEIWMFTYAAPDKRRPVLVVSRPEALAHLRTATVAPISSTIRGLPSEVVLGVEHGLKQASAVNLDHLVTVPQNALSRFVGTVDAEAMRRVCRAAAIALGCR